MLGAIFVYDVRDGHSRNIRPGQCFRSGQLQLSDMAILIKHIYTQEQVIYKTFVHSSPDTF